MDIREAFLQGNTLDKDIFMKPPEDQRIDGWFWKLKKPLYGLDDPSRKFWLKLRDKLMNLDLKVMIGDEVFIMCMKEVSFKL